MLDRRSLLTGFGALALGTAARPAWPRPGLDLDNRRDLLTALVKLRGATDPRLVIGYVVGARYAVPEHRIIPMMGFLAATFSQYRRLDDDSFEARALEIGYFTDLASGKLLETWRNPVTGTTVDVPHTRMGPSRIIVTADGLTVPRPSGEAAGLELKHVFLPPVIVGDNVWVTEQINVDGPPAPRPFVYNELTTYQALKSELDDPARASVQTRVQYQSLITYRPWMGFGDTPGHTVARGSGLHVARLDDLPPYYLELTRRRHPDVLKDPLALLAG
ncbi:MAG: DUF1838 domain-containing protein [Gammaproteobacteria bacterium]|nr:DUF1838 domain-containing protein [Gammaproteobacteria bacterium]